MLKYKLYEELHILLSLSYFEHIVVSRMEQVCAKNYLLWRIRLNVLDYFTCQTHNV